MAATASKGKVINQSQLETDDEMQLYNVSTKQTKQSKMGDTRIKNLENIYSQSRPSTNLKKQRTAMQGKSNSAWDFSDPSPQVKFRPMMQHSYADTTGVESSDQDEFRLKQELDKMQAIIDRDQKFKKPP